MQINKCAGAKSCGLAEDDYCTSEDSCWEGEYIPTPEELSEYEETVRMKRDYCLNKLIDKCDHSPESTWNGMFYSYTGRCIKCKEYFERTNYSSPDGFFKLWKWAKQEAWWYDFWSCRNRMPYIGYMHEDDIDSNVFANLIYKYLKDNELL